MYASPRIHRIFVSATQRSRHTLIPEAVNIDEGPNLWTKIREQPLSDPKIERPPASNLLYQATLTSY